MPEHTNILKVRDDNAPFRFLSDDTQKFTIMAEVQKPVWLSGDELTITSLRERIEPWLTSLFQSEHLSLLIGSGLSTAIQHIASVTIPDNGMGKPELPRSCPHAEEIHKYAAISAKKNGRGDTGNIEDYFRVINDLLQGLNILGNLGSYNSLYKTFEFLIIDFLESII
jgi:hypothetical protein